MTEVRCITIAYMNNTLGLGIRGKTRENYSKKMKEQARKFNGGQNEKSEEW